MGTPTQTAASELEIHTRSISAHLANGAFRKLRETSVLIGGIGGGSNIAELLARKGFGRMVIADPDVYEPHNVRQRGSLSSTWGRPKVEVMRERLLDIDPHLDVDAVPEGVTAENVQELVASCDYVVDMIDFHGLAEKVALHRSARAQGKTVLTAPSVVNGAVLYVFAPRGIAFEEFFNYVEGIPLSELGMRFLKHLIPDFPDEAPRGMYEAAARGERTIPLDAVGVDQAGVLLVGALENLVLGRRDRVMFVPKGIQVDGSDPCRLARIIDFSVEFL